jgi:teichuronic acid biosynthesis glycosyltransferase TuaC
MRLRFAVITPNFPSQAEPYRGAPIWATLRSLVEFVDLSVYCSVPVYPFGFRPPGYLYSLPSTKATDRLFPCTTVTYPALPVLSRPFNGRALYKAVRRELRGKPDTVLAYWGYPDGFAAVRLGEELGIPSVVSTRGSDLRVIAKTPFLTSKFRYVMSHASAVVGVSKDLSAIAMELGAVPARVHTVHNGVDTAVFAACEQAAARQELGISAGCKLVVYAGRLVEKKGLPALIESIAVLRGRQPEADWRAVLVGKGPLAEKLRSQAQTLRIDGSILMPGAQNPEQIAAWLNAGDLFCLASDTEGCPNVVLEALSCGRAVVATAVGGIPELVNEGCGILIPDNRSESLVRGLKEAALREWDREQIVRASRRSWQQVARETFEICRSCLGTPVSDSGPGGAG